MPPWEKNTVAKYFDKRKVAAIRSRSCLKRSDIGYKPSKIYSLAYILLTKYENSILFYSMVVYIIKNISIDIGTDPSVCL